MQLSILDVLPVWSVFIVMVIVLLVVAEIGFRIGVGMQDRGATPGDSRMTGTVVGGMLGLVAFLMAFSTGMAVGTYG